MPEDHKMNNIRDGLLRVMSELLYDRYELQISSFNKSCFFLDLHSPKTRKTKKTIKRKGILARLGSRNQNDEMLFLDGCILVF